MLFRSVPGNVLLHLAWRDGFVHYSENHIADLPKHYHFLKQMVDAGIAKISVIGAVIVMIAVSFMKDAKKYMENLEKSAKEKREK